MTTRQRAEQIALNAILIAASQAAIERSRRTVEVALYRWGSPR